MLRIPARLAAAALPLLLTAAPAGAAPGVGEVGTVAAEFSLQDTFGATHTLSAHRGQVVLLFIVGYG